MDQNSSHQQYLVLSEDAQTEIEVKRSQFIAIAKRVQGVADAKQKLHEIKDAYPDAGHHCYGFIAGAPSDSQTYGYSDDGEPSGTAGKPIFTRVQHSGIGELLIVVVRYFGGTKLGTGGLARAYGDAASEVMAKLKTEPFIATKIVKVKVAFAREGDMRRAIEQCQGQVLSEEYGAEVTLTARIPVGKELPVFY